MTKMQQKITQMMRMISNLIVISLITLTISGCTSVQPEVVYPEAIQREIFKPVAHQGRTAIVSGNSAETPKNYFTLFGATIEIPNGYNVEDKSSDNALNFRIYNEESNAVVTGTSMMPDMTISENDILFEAVDYVVGETYGEDVRVFDYGSPVHHGNYYYVISHLSNNNTVATVVNRDVILVLATPNDEALLKTILNELLNPQPPTVEVKSLPETYTRIMGGFYYTAETLGSGQFNVYALDEIGSTVQVFDANMTEVFGMYLVQNNFAYENKATITLDKTSTLYVSKDVAIEKVQ